MDKTSSRMQILTGVIANIPTFIYGVQLGWLSPMRLVLQNENISNDDITWMATAMPLTALLSLPIFMYASDKIGRKKSIILLSTAYCLSWLLKLLFMNPAALITARALAGFASCGNFLVIPLYIKEISEDHLRGCLGSLLTTTYSIGVIAIYTIGMVFSYKLTQGVFLALSVCHVIIFSLMPESPAFLIKKGREEEAAKTIAWLRSLNQNDNIVIKEIEKLKEEDVISCEKSNLNFKAIYNDKGIFRPIIACLVLILVQTLSGAFAIFNYASAIFESAGSKLSPNLSALCVSILQLAGAILATITVDKFGRKILLMISTSTISVCMCVMVAYFLFLDQNILPNWVPVAAVCVSIFSFGAGLAPVPFLYMAEVFSFHLRARLMGLIMTLSWFDSTVTIFLFATLTENFGEHVVFSGFAFITMFGAVFTYIYVPETKGKSLEDIQSDFKNK